MNKQSGFTIVELLVVIVVIGVLAAITIANYSGLSNRSTESSLQSDLSNASKQLKLYNVDNGEFPTSNDCSSSPASKSICLKASNGATYTYTRTSPQKFNLTITDKSGNIKYSLDEDSAPTPGAYVALWDWANETSWWSHNGDPLLSNVVSDPSGAGKGDVLLLDWNTFEPWWGGFINNSGGLYSFENGSSYTVTFDIYGESNKNLCADLSASADTLMGGDYPIGSQQTVTTNGNSWSQISWSTPSFLGQTGNYYLFINEGCGESSWWIGNVTVTKN